MTKKHYIASVRDFDNKQMLIERDDYTSKRAFANDLRGNGFRVRFISTPENFDTDAHKYDEKLRNDRNYHRIMRRVRKEYTRD